MSSSSGGRRRPPHASLHEFPALSRRRHLTRLLALLGLLVLGALILGWASSSGSTRQRTSLDDGRARVVARDWQDTTRRTERTRLARDHNEMRFQGSARPASATDEEPQPVVLVLTPMKNSLEHIWHYFHLLDTLSYPRHLLQIGILVSDSTDATYSRAVELADERQYNSGKRGVDGRGKYGKITLFRKDFALTEERVVMQSSDDADDEIDNAPIASDPNGLANIGKSRHSYALQLPRRRLLARSRSWLLASALTPEVDYVLWMDVDVVEYEKELVQTLMGWMVKEQVEVVVPNCMWKSYNEMGGYDLNNWIETAQSKALKATLAPDDVLIEGYPSHPTHRLALTSLYPPTAHTPPSITLDGVGGCTTLVLASIHREGAIFPSWPVDHQIETEGFAQIVKRLGGRMIGLTGVFVYHGLYG